LPNKTRKVVLNFELLVCRDVTFICGRAGVCALGAVAAKDAGDDESLRYYLAQFQQVLQFDYITFRINIKSFAISLQINTVFDKK